MKTEKNVVFKGFFERENEFGFDLQAWVQDRDIPVKQNPCRESN